MTQQQKDAARWWIGLLGPAITVIALGATMAVGFGAQGQSIKDISAKVDKLYDVLIFPRVEKGP